MTKIKVLIVDDEPRAHKILENYIARTPELELVGNCYNAVEAYKFLKAHPVNLVFLDITMPEVDGFGFLKMLDKPPLIIFTTAHSEFALESYEYNAVDYLKKPIPFERFTKAINKLIHWIEKGITMEPVTTNIDLKIEGSIRSISLSQILFIQSLGNYVKIVLEDKILITQITTTELEENLPKSQFLRIHKSIQN
jgi:DNA-binding LytR/AlgR family response regulator